MNDREISVSSFLSLSWPIIFHVRYYQEALVCNWPSRKGDINPSKFLKSRLIELCQPLSALYSTSTRPAPHDFGTCELWVLEEPRWSIITYSLNCSVSETSSPVSVSDCKCSFSWVSAFNLSRCVISLDSYDHRDMEAGYKKNVGRSGWLCKAFLALWH